MLNASFSIAVTVFYSNKIPEKTLLHELNKQHDNKRKKLRNL